MGLIDKEVIRPGEYWYTDADTGQPRKLTVTPELCKYWHDQGNAMLATGLTVPVPAEHDFNAHPMTPAEKLLNNSGWVRGYSLKDGALHSSVEILNPEVEKKLPHTIRWTSPWINSFTDGNGKEWKNVISHLALTARPRIINQKPFGSVAAALSMAEPVRTWSDIGHSGIHLSRAGLLLDSGLPKYPIAFSMWSGSNPSNLDTYQLKNKKGKKGKAFGVADLKKKPVPDTNVDPDNDDDLDIDGDDEDTDDDAGFPDDGDPTNDDNIDLPPIGSEEGDVSMVELLCDLLGALGITVEHSTDEENFKRQLYNAAMTEIHNLTGKAKAGEETNRTNPPGQPPNNPKQKPGEQNPLVPQQEQQPMYMSLDEINKIPDATMKTIALSMYNENQKLRADMAANAATVASLRDAKLKEANDKRATRVALLGKLCPKAKPDIDAMLALPAMALSLGAGGEVIDPLNQTLAVLEKGLASLPQLLNVEQSALAVQPHPSDADMMDDKRSDEIADNMARMMGCPPAKS